MLLPCIDCSVSEDTHRSVRRQGWMGFECYALERHAILRRTFLRRSSPRKVNLLMSGDDDANATSRNNPTSHHRMQTYYGYSFESYCTSSSPHKSNLPGYAPGWSGDVDTNIQWCSVVKTKLADTRLLIGGEVDCVRGMLQSIVLGADNVHS